MAGAPEIRSAAGAPEACLRSDNVVPLPHVRARVADGLCIFGTFPRINSLRFSTNRRVRGYR